jgi:hypothetical protein
LKTKYVLLNEAKELHAQIFDIYESFRIIKRINEIYDVKIDSLKTGALETAKKAVNSPETAERLTTSLIKFVNDAMFENDYEMANKAANIAEQTSKLAKQPQLIKQAGELGKKITEKKDLYAKAKEAERILITEKKTDATASLNEGLYLISRDDWVSGPLYLRDGNDAELKTLGEKEISKPKQSNEQYALAEAWYSWASKTKNSILKEKALERALFWYEDSEFGAQGLLKDKIRKRIEELQSATGCINLLRLIDPDRDAVFGKWSSVDGRIQSDMSGDPKNGEARIEIPYQPPAEYDLKITFTPTQGTGENKIVLSKGGKAFAYVVSAHLPEGTPIAGFEVVNNQRAAGNTTNAKLDKPLEKGRNYTAVMQVRNDGVKAYLDDKLTSQLKTDYKDMGIFWSQKLRDDTLLGLVTWRSAVRYNSIEVYEITGKGKRTR